MGEQICETKKELKRRVEVVKVIVKNMVVVLVVVVNTRTDPMKLCIYANNVVSCAWISMQCNRM
jgi:hypothetical protein